MNSHIRITLLYGFIYRGLEKRQALNMVHTLMLFFQNNEALQIIEKMICPNAVKY